MFSPILSLQAPARAEYEKKEIFYMNTKQVDDRIDRIALAYVTAHYDVSQMDASEFFEKFKKAYTEISEIYSYGN